MSLLMSISCWPLLVVFLGQYLSLVSRAYTIEQNWAYIDDVIAKLNNRENCDLPSINEINELNNSFHELESDLGTKEFQIRLSEDQRHVLSTLLLDWANFWRRMDSGVIIRSAKQRIFLIKIESYQLSRFGRSVCARYMSYSGPLTDTIFDKHPVIRYADHIQTIATTTAPRTAGFDIGLVDGNSFGRSSQLMSKTINYRSSQARRVFYQKSNTCSVPKELKTKRIIARSVYQSEEVNFCVAEQPISLHEPIIIQLPSLEEGHLRRSSPINLTQIEIVLKRQDPLANVPVPALAPVTSSSDAQSPTRCKSPVPTFEEGFLSKKLPNDVEEGRTERILTAVAPIDSPYSGISRSTPGAATLETATRAPNHSLETEPLMKAAAQKNYATSLESDKPGRCRGDHGSFKLDLDLTTTKLNFEPTTSEPTTGELDSQPVTSGPAPGPKASDSTIDSKTSEPILEPATSKPLLEPETSEPKESEPILEPKPNKSPTSELILGTNSNESNFEPVTSESALELTTSEIGYELATHEHFFATPGDPDLEQITAGNIAVTSTTERPKFIFSSDGTEYIDDDYDDEDLQRLCNNFTSSMDQSVSGVQYEFDWPDEPEWGRLPPIAINSPADLYSETDKNWARFLAECDAEPTPAARLRKMKKDFFKSLRTDDRLHQNRARMGQMDYVMPEIESSNWRTIANNNFMRMSINKNYMGKSPPVRKIKSLLKRGDDSLERRRRLLR